jgi:glutamate synthase (NADPH/NADH) small chain
MAEQQKYTYKGLKLSPEERKARLATHRCPMRERDATERSTTFDEVNLGYNAEQAKSEANRCLFCPGAPCVTGCPVQIKIPEFLEATAKGEFDKALEIIRGDNSLPAVTGRVCPQEIQCEGRCTLGKSTGEPVGIGYIERFLADYSRGKASNGSQLTASKPTAPSATRRKRVAVVGSGPGGLTVAADLAKMGHDVHIFEAFHKPGGVLAYGIPSFRLPKEVIDFEIEALQNLGITIHTNAVVGNLYSLDDLQQHQGFDAIYLGIGAGLPKFMNLAGENLNGVCSANEYLTRVNLMKSYLFPQYDTPVQAGGNVAVFGGGNVAMDAVRTAKRLGAKKAYLIYRRSRAEMPARVEEVHHAEDEGVEFLFLTNPTRFIDNERGWLAGVECLKMELGEPDASGRRSPRAVLGSEYVLPIDTAIIAVGTGANPLLTNAHRELATNKWGYIAVDAAFRTSRPGVFAGGDIVRGAATVILAMGDGRAAARSIDDYLQTATWAEPFTPTTFES